MLLDMTSQRAASRQTFRVAAGSVEKLIHAVGAAVSALHLDEGLSHFKSCGHDSPEVECSGIVSIRAGRVNGSIRTAKALLEATHVGKVCIRIGVDIGGVTLGCQRSIDSQ